MACAMVYWGSHPDRFFKIFIKHGAVVPLEQLRDSEICTSSEPLNDTRQNTPQRSLK